MRNRTMKINSLREKRKLRVRKKLRGTSERPRLCVMKSNKHLQAQLIDDNEAKVIAGIATFSKKFRQTEFGRKSKQAARKLGDTIAAAAQEKNIKQVVFDRGPFKYHGIIAELAEAVRAAGIQF